MAGTEPTASGRTGNRTSTARLAKAAGIVGAATLTSRLLGLVRDTTLAFLFGAGNAMDAFNVAFRIPNLMRDLFAEGAMSAAFVPTFTKRLTVHGKAAAWHIGNQLVNALLIVTGTLVVLGIVFADPLTRLLAGDYAEVPGKLELTVSLTRIMLPFLTLVALAAAMMGMLNSLERFFMPALSPAMFNVGVIGSAILLVPIMPRFGLQPITGIAIGAIVGGVGQIALQLRPLYREGYRYRLGVNPSDPGLREMLSLIGPGTLAGAAAQINLLVNMVLATGEGTGAVSWLSYAFRVMYLPIGIFGVSIATATLPVVSRHAAQEQLSDIRQTVSNALRLLLILNIPALVGLMVLAEPIVGLIFERGSFTSDDTLSTAAALWFYAPGLLGYSTVRIAVPCFYALGSSVTPTAVSIFSVVFNIVLNLILVRIMGFRGLALGASIAVMANAAILLFLLRRRIGGLDLGRVLGTGLRISFAASLMGVTVVAGHTWLSDIAPGTSLMARLGQVFGSIALGLGALAVGAKAVGLHELTEVGRRLLARVAAVASR